MKKNYPLLTSNKSLFPFFAVLLFAGSLFNANRINAQCTPRSLPWSETWSATSFSTCTPTTGGWVAQGTGTHIAQDGGVGEEASNISCTPTECEGGTYPDLAFYGNQCYPEAATLRAYSPPVNTTGVSSVTFSFVDYYFSGSPSALINMQVQTSTDAVTWRQVWTQTGLGTDIDGSAGVTFTISNADLNNATTYFAFYLSSNELCYLNDWFIDNVSVVGLSTPAITGFNPASGCAGTQSITITGTNLTGATSVTIGGTPVQSISSNTATQIVVLVGSGTSGAIAVTTPNGTAYSSTNFTFTTTPATPGTISGPTTVCNASTNTYSVVPVNGATSYTWTLPGGWTGTSTTNSIDATQGTGVGNITVTANNGCGSSTAQSLAVTLGAVPPTPGSIAGPTSVCNLSTNNYSIATVTGATSYTWTLPGGWSGTSSTDSVSALAGSTGGNISVTANNACGSSPAQTLSVSVTSAPAPPGAITGPDSTCRGTQDTFSISSVSGATSYTWTLPGGWTGGSVSENMNATAGSVGGNVSVTANNNCGASSAQSKTVLVNPTPQVTFTFNGNPICTSQNPVTLNSGTPAGGTYSGQGVSGNTFDPSTLSSGNYVVTYSYTSAQGCYSSDSATFIVTICTGVLNTDAPKLEVYPNPFSGELVIKTNGNYASGKAILIDPIGRALKEVELNKGLDESRINTSNLTKGAYLLNIVIDDKPIIVKKVFRLE